MNQKQKIAFYTLIRKEVHRFLRLWQQTLLPPMITMFLYFLIFGQIVGSKVGSIGGQPYILFIAPGIIMLSMLTNSYSNVASSFFIEKFVRSIEEMIYAPIYTISIVLGFMIAGTLRGLLVGMVVFAVAHLFINIDIIHPWFAFLIAFLANMCMAGFGLLNALYANHFDGINLIPTFVITPLIYLGGVFFPINMLPKFWQLVSLFNPLAYIVSVFRYALTNHMVLYLPYILLAVLGLLVFLVIFCVNKINRLEGVVLK